MKKITVNEYKYRGAFGEDTFDDVTVFIPDGYDAKKIRKGKMLADIDYSVPANEIKRIEREMALRFFTNAYRSIMNNDRTISVEELKGIQDILELNRTEFGKLLGLHKGSVTNLFKGKGMKTSLCLLIMERLGMELGRPGSARHMLDGGNPQAQVSKARDVINKTRYAA